VPLALRKTLEFPLPCELGLYCPNWSPKICAPTNRNWIPSQPSMFGTPTMYLAKSYMAFLERRLRNLSQETRYGIEQMIINKVTSGKYLNMTHPPSRLFALLQPLKPTHMKSGIMLNVLRFSGDEWQPQLGRVNCQGTRVDGLTPHIR
jgi:hypothetical protein